MDSTIDRARSVLRATTPYLPAGGVVALIVGAAVVGFRFGAPAIVLWFAFAALAGAILLFWESLRSLMNDSVRDEAADLDVEVSALSDLEERKRAALRALKDIEFEHSIHRISDDDYEALRLKYRAEARQAMEALDQGLGQYLPRAEELVESAGGRPSETRKNRKKGREKSADEKPAEPPSSDKLVANAEAKTAEPEATHDCPSCATVNDADAVFCKKCGTRLAAET